MNVNGSVRRRDGWYVTEKGKLDRLTLETCRCDPRLSGLLLTCTQCGTVYGSMRNVYTGRRGFDGKIR